MSIKDTNNTCQISIIDIFWFQLDSKINNSKTNNNHNYKDGEEDETQRNHAINTWC